VYRSTLVVNPFDDFFEPPLRIESRRRIDNSAQTLDPEIGTVRRKAFCDTVGKDVQAAITQFNAGGFETYLRENPNRRCSRDQLFVFPVSTPE
jgi:hypothetical protein